MNARGWLWLERAQATLPLLAAAGLAGFTWWLVQSSPRTDGAQRASLASSAPDFTLYKARVARFDATGRVEAVLDGDTMRHYPDTDRLQIDHLSLSARDEQGQGLQAVAARGEADHRAALVTLSGGAQVTVMPAKGRKTGETAVPTRFSGEGLQVDTDTRVVTSRQPVLLQQEGSTVRAQGMRYDDRTGLADLSGRVKGHYEVLPP